MKRIGIHTIIGTIFVANIVVTAIFWWLGSSVLFFQGTTSGILIAIGRITGLYAELFILIELVLISRIPFIEHAYGFDRLNRLHRKIGYVLLCCIFAHPFLITFGYALAGKISYFAQSQEFISHWEDVLAATIGLSVLIVTSILSIPYIRRWFAYETWHISHLGMYIAIALIFGHQTQTASVSFGIAFYYWFTLNTVVFGALVLYRFLMPFFRFYKHRFYVEKIVQETPDVYSVYIKGRKMDKFNFEAGQYIHVSFLSKGMWQPHPFSLSVAPNGSYIRISAKSLGDYTAKIKSIKPNTKVLIEGPFGRFTEGAALYEKYLFIAGGIGITPIRALAESVGKKGKDMVLLYGAKTSQDVAFKKDLDSLIKNKHYILSGEEKEGFEKGYIDKEIMQKNVPDIKNREVYVCGPQGMTQAVISSLIALGVNKKQIHSEQFSY